MELTSMCRICLAVGVQMHMIRARHLQEMYESLSKTSFKTEDNRPTQACYICFARLKNCYQLRETCMQSEQLLTDLLSSSMVNPAELRERYSVEQLTITPPAQMSLTDVVRRHSYSVFQRNSETGVYYEVKVLPAVAEGDIEETDPLGIDGIEPANTLVPAELPRAVPCKIKKKELDVTNKQTDPLGVDGIEPANNLVPAELPRAVPRKIKKKELDVTNKSAPVPESARTKQTNCQSTSTRDLESSDRTETVDVPKMHQPSSSNIDDFRYRAKAYHCHVCNKRFCRKYDLSLHIGRHTGKLPYQCSDCKKFFTQKSVLVTHIRRVHSQVLPFECYVCKKAFRYKAALDNHERTHTGEKPFQCKVCSKNFSQVVTLKRHSLIHTGEKPHHCTVCKKSFARKCALDMHFRVHTGEKPYQCHICMRCFRCKSSLNSHIISCIRHVEQSNPVIMGVAYVKENEIFGT